MAKQQRRKSHGSDAKVGTGGVTDVQIAFLVDCYLKDHNYMKTLQEFRLEASSVLAPYKSEAPMTMMSLSTILNDYIVLKEQAISVQQEKAKMDHFLAGMKDMLRTYECTPVHCLAPVVPATTTGTVIPSRVETPSTAVTQMAPVKKRSPPKIQEPPIVEITNTAGGGKRIRHMSVLPSLSGKDAGTANIPQTPKAGLGMPRSLFPASTQRIPHKPAVPFSPPTQRPPSLDPQTPQQQGMLSPEQCPAQGSEGFSRAATLCPTQANPPLSSTSCEPSKARSKRQALKPTTSKCKSLDFTTSEPLNQVTPATISKDEEAPGPLALDLPILCEDLFTTEPLSSIDDILGASLDGSSFSDLMNSMMVDDVMQEINSPSAAPQKDPQRDSSHTDPGTGFVAQVICLEDNDLQDTKAIQEAAPAAATAVKARPSGPKSSRKSPGKENTPPKKAKR